MSPPQQQHSRPPGGWSDQWSPIPPQPPPVRRKRPRWRVFTWFIIAFNLVMLIWVIAAIAANARNCNGLVGDALTYCDAHNAGVGIGTILLFVFWALGDFILLVLWLVTQPRRRNDDGGGFR